MTNEQLTIIEQVKNAMQAAGYTTVQFMNFDGEIAVFETAERRGYKKYTVNVEQAIAEDWIQIQSIVYLIEGDDEEIAISEVVTKYDELMQQTAFDFEIVKSYKREATAVKNAAKLAEQNNGTWELSNC